jgi:hypothetical protein
LRNFKIFQLISTFSKEEFKEFEHFIKSPSLNINRDYSQMLYTIYSYHLNWDRLNSITNKEFYEKIFPGKPYSNKTLRNRLNELTVVAKKFIILKTCENEKSHNNLMLLKGLKDRKRLGLFRSEFIKINNEIDKDSSKSHYNSEIKLLSVYVYLENQDYKKTFDSFRNHTDYKLTYYLENIFEMMLELIQRITLLMI